MCVVVVAVQLDSVCVHFSLASCLLGRTAARRCLVSPVILCGSAPTCATIVCGSMRRAARLPLTVMDSIICACANRKNGTYTGSNRAPRVCWCLEVDAETNVTNLDSPISKHNLITNQSIRNLDFSPAPFFESVSNSHIIHQHDALSGWQYSTAFGIFKTCSMQRLRRFHSLGACQSCCCHFLLQIGESRPSWLVDHLGTAAFSSALREYTLLKKTDEI